MEKKTRQPARRAKRAIKYILSPCVTASETTSIDLQVDLQATKTRWLCTRACNCIRTAFHFRVSAPGEIHPSSRRLPLWMTLTSCPSVRRSRGSRHATVAFEHTRAGHHAQYTRHLDWRPCMLFTTHQTRGQSLVACAWIAHTSCSDDSRLRFT